MASNTRDKGGLKLRSQAWFDNPENIDMTALYIERYLNYGLSQDELQSGRLGTAGTTTICKGLQRFAFGRKNAWSLTLHSLQQNPFG